jgi:hypothetical protein
MEFEKEFNIDIPDEDAEKLRTVGDAVATTWTAKVGAAGGCDVEVVVGLVPMLPVRERQWRGAAMKRACRTVAGASLNHEVRSLPRFRCDSPQQTKGRSAQDHGAERRKRADPAYAITRSRSVRRTTADAGLRSGRYITTLDRLGVIVSSGIWRS